MKKRLKFRHTGDYDDFIYIIDNCLKYGTGITIDMRVNIISLRNKFTRYKNIGYKTMKINIEESKAIDFISKNLRHTELSVSSNNYAFGFLLLNN